MRIIALLAAGVVAWLVVSRRRRQEVAPVVVPPATPAPVDTAESTADETPRAEELSTDTGRLDASAGWDDGASSPEQDRPQATSDVVDDEDREPPRRPEPVPPGMSGDDTLGVAAWDRPV